MLLFSGVYDSDVSLWHMDVKLISNTYAGHNDAVEAVQLLETLEDQTRVALDCSGISL